MATIGRSERHSSAEVPPFDGWRVAWAAFAVMAVAYGVQFSFGVLVPDIEADTGWSRTQISLAYSVYVLLYSVLSIASGLVTDRSGPRVVLIGGAVFLAGGYALAGLSQQLWQLYLAFGVLAAVGMSAAYVPCNATVVRWFVRRRGTALSVSTAGVGVGGLLVPPLAGLASTAWGWRATYLGLALAAGLCLLVAARVMVGSPEERGQYPDGDPAPPAVSGGTGATLATGLGDLGVRLAVRTPAFWLIFAVFGATWIVVFFPPVHLSPFAEDLGLSRVAASAAVGAIGLGGLAGRLVSGSVSDRVGRLPMLAVVVGLQAGAFALFAVSSGPLTLYPAAVVFGFGYGGSTSLFPAVVGDQFGRAHVGALVGLIFGGAGSLAAVGPGVAGYLYDVTGGYRTAFALAAGANVVSLAMVGLLALATSGTSRPDVGPISPASPG
jgi:MFS family permease